MPVGLPSKPNLLPVKGVRLGVTAAGLKDGGRTDLAVIECAPGTKLAGVFTRNQFCAAPVIVAREHLQKDEPRICVINTKSANVGTGPGGLDAARKVCHALSKQLACNESEVLPFSTGVVGETLPLEKIENALADCVADLKEDGWLAAAEAIMTTDTVAKGLSREFVIGGKKAVVTGIVKGAGMIRPDMATMLAFVGTDVKLPADVLQTALTGAIKGSFNRITVDGDTSTNDACIVMATGQGEVSISQVDSDEYKQFYQVLEEVLLYLAQAIIRDAEGVTKFITIDIINGKSEQDCLQVAYAIAHSPLVKTAFFASDPNWGRILAAVGRAGVVLENIDKVKIHLGDVCIVEHGMVSPGYTEERGQAVMDQNEITVSIDLAQGQEKARVWTSDLSYDYVKINAEYRS